MYSLKLCLSLLICLAIIWTSEVQAATWTASCSQASIAAAQTSATNGDTISVSLSPQDCDTSNQWGSTLEITKQLTIQGQGTSSTKIGMSAGTSAFRIRANNVRITGIAFDANGFNTTNVGLIMAGYNSTAACTGAIAYSDYRIDHNSFSGLDVSDPSGCLGCNAIVIRGDVYGLIDHNTFNNCSGECIDVQGAGYFSFAYSNAPGQYAANHTNYIEDNIWNFSQTASGENAVDGNSGGRYVFRYNTINLSGTGSINGVISTHDCSNGDVCNGNTQNDTNIRLVEAYRNTINNTNNRAGFMINWRGGSIFLWDNTIIGSNWEGGGNPPSLVDAYYLRSGHRAGCLSVTHRGYSEYCHEYQAGAINDGIANAATTLNGALGNDAGCPTLASTAGFDTWGGSILVGTEQIDYTGISGNTLTPCTRGANTAEGLGPRATHANGSSVSRLIFGQCADAPTNGWMWGNLYKVTSGAAGAASNGLWVDNIGNWPGWGDYDIKSFTERPQNYQYRNDGTAYSYTPYPYPHPLQGGVIDTTPPAAPTGVTISQLNALYERRDAALIACMAKKE